MYGTEKHTLKSSMELWLDDLNREIVIALMVLNLQIIILLQIYGG